MPLLLAARFYLCKTGTGLTLAALRFLHPLALLLECVVPSVYVQYADGSYNVAAITNIHWP